MKNIKPAISVAFLFILSLYLGTLQGNSDALIDASSMHFSASAALSPMVYTGVAAFLANLFSGVFNAILPFLSGDVLTAIVVLALMTELVLLYPSVRLQIQQKTLHLFHRKLADRFQNGELKVTKAKRELEQLYAANETLHARGALLVVLQILVVIAAFFGINLLVKAPYLLTGASWSVSNVALLSPLQGYSLPLVAALLYLLHSLVKINIKQKQDYLGSAQLRLALLFSVLISEMVFAFASIAPSALVLFMASFIAFSTLRFIAVEAVTHPKILKKAHADLVKKLRASKPASNFVTQISHRFNHLPVFRYLNLHLFEEALSMSLLCLLVLNVLA